MGKSSELASSELSQKQRAARRNLPPPAPPSTTKPCVPTCTCIRRWVERLSLSTISKLNPKTQNPRIPKIQSAEVSTITLKGI